jgi:hypothetical protein
MGDAGRISLYVSTSTHLLADVFDYFLAAGASGGGGDAVQLQGLTIAPHNTSVPYNRDEWQHWIDDDGDCQDTRAEVLWIESETSLQYDTAGCVVVSGQWEDPCTGQVWTAASDLDVDHTVALQNAHVSGGHAWDAARKRAYANDCGGGDDEAAALRERVEQLEAEASEKAAASVTQAPVETAAPPSPSPEAVDTVGFVMPDLRGENLQVARTGCRSSGSSTPYRTTSSASATRCSTATGRCAPRRLFPGRW